MYLIHIDNWFNRKWLRYSGYGVVAFPDGYPWILVAKEEHHQKQLTFPPFTPNRVVAQYLFCRVAEAVYEEHARANSSTAGSGNGARRIYTDGWRISAGPDYSCGTRRNR